MVGRIEIVLALLLGLALWLGLGNQQEILRAKAAAKQERKSMELRDAHVREVNATGVMEEFDARHAVLIRKTWYMDDFALRNPDIRSLVARKAVRSERQIRLEGNVTMERDDGAVYRAEKVLYDPRTKVLRSVGPFVGTRGDDYVRGVDFVYEVIPKRTYARRVFARYRLADGAKGLRPRER